MLIQSVGWVARGPYNVGGRTRGIALDITNENVIIAGGVSGGIWRSTDLGATWNKSTGNDQLHNATCIAQDTRQGKTNIWYCGTGEAYGNSAGASFTAPFLGDGIYKSTDGGINWEPLEATHSGTPYWFDSWDYIWDIAIDPTNDTADVVYAACYKSVMKSMDGGESWDAVFPFSNSGGSYFSDIEVSSEGVVYLTQSFDNPTFQNVADKGIFRSIDGETWTRIVPSDLPASYLRMVIGINPSNENEVYFLANTPNSGQHSLVFFGGEEWNSLWKYTYISGDGTGAGGQWENLSDYIPNNSPFRFNNFYAQGSYNLSISVKPGNEDVVFIGGTNIYRSTDGFTSQNNTTQIAGYRPGSTDYDWGVYDTQHPDQHKTIFLSSNPDVLISANDGGIFKTTNCMADTVSWDRLNNGYNTTQLYTIIIDETATNDIMIGGFQDNGNFFTNSSDPQATWVMPLNGDGSFGAIADNGDTYYLSIQRGRIFKMHIDDNGNALEFARIDPIGGADYDFINPFVVDPNDNNVMYVPQYRGLWRNDSLSSIPMANNTDSISTGWFRYSDDPPSTVTAIAISKSNPAHRLYYASSGRVYRIDSANVNDPVEHTQYSLPSGALGNINCIAIDPNNADNVLAVLSNYRVYSLAYTNDGGENWYKVAGNLEEYASGSGNGPSCRWAEIVPYGDSTIFLLGTSVGIYATDTLILDVDSTVWYNVGDNVIGNVVVEMIKTRQTDNLVAVATHGNGAYSMHLDGLSISEFLSNKEPFKHKTELLVYPNPSSEVLNIRYSDVYKKTMGLVYNINGQLVDKFSIVNDNTQIDVSKYKKGIYYIVIESASKKETEKFVVM